MMNPMPSVLIPLAQGCEELEAITIIDLMRRAGVMVTTAGLDHHPIHASRGTTLLADTTLDEALNQDYEMIVLPGGQPGADNLNQDERVHGVLKEMAEAGRYTAAICAAPKVLARAGLLKGKTATAYPGTLEALDIADIQISTEAIIIDGNVITSRGPGTAMNFSLTLIEILTDRDTRERVEAGLVRD